MIEAKKNIVRLSARRMQTPLQEEDIASDMKLQVNLIQQYVDLQRILTATDMKKEAEYQLKTVKVKLGVMGVVTEDLDVH